MTNVELLALIISIAGLALTICFGMKREAEEKSPEQVAAAQGLFFAVIH